MLQLLEVLTLVLAVINRVLPRIILHVVVGRRFQGKVLASHPWRMTQVTISVRRNVHRLHLPAVQPDPLVCLGLLGGVTVVISLSI
jgi:hypothetical protein